MFYVPFHIDFPEIAERETKTLIIADHYDGNLPAGSYGLLEYYCSTPDCDCRRVMLHVHSDKSEGFLAVINFGWESRKFYEGWLGGDDKDWIHELKGPSLNTSSPQSQYSNELLALLNDQILKDRAYINTLKRHYSIFKDKVNETGVVGIKQFQKPIQSPSAGRNDPCPCGSGLKHKKCCGK